MIIGIIFTDAILLLFGATPDILPYARDYVRIILLGSVFISLAMASNGIIRAEGQAKVAMQVMMLGAGLNIVFDPIFIFVFKLGIQGVAIATVISQFIAFLFIIRFFRTSRSTLPLQKESFIPKRKVQAEIITLGIPALVRQTGTSMMALTVNNMLRIYGGDLAIASFGMIIRMMMFLIMPILGIVQGFQPIAGYNYGALKFDRVKAVMKTAMAASTFIGIAALIIIQLFSRQLLSVFSTDQELLDIAAPAFRIMMAVIPLIGIQVIGSSLFQALGKRTPSIFLSLSRQFIFLIPLVLILPRFFKLSGVWAAFPAADLLSVVVTSISVASEVKKLNRAASLQSSAAGS